jgi:glucose/arabinose dehydrogenase
MEELITVAKLALAESACEESTRRMVGTSPAAGESHKPQMATVAATFDLFAAQKSLRHLRQVTQSSDQQTMQQRERGLSRRKGGNLRFAAHVQNSSSRSSLLGFRWSNPGLPGKPRS